VSEVDSKWQKPTKTSLKGGRIRLKLPEVLKWHLKVSEVTSKSVSHCQKCKKPLESVRRIWNLTRKYQKPLRKWQKPMKRNLKGGEANLKSAKLFESARAT